MTADTPLVTTIIPTYRRPHLLRRAVKSALAQQGVSLQVCVYDNASGDETREVVEAIAAEDDRVKYVGHPVNIGAFANFQFGLQHVETPFFSFLSDDDVLLPGFYEAALAGLADYPDAMFWAGVTIRMTPTGKVYDARVDQWPREGKYTAIDGLMQMTSGLAPIWTGAVVRQKVLETVGLLDPDVGSAADFDWLLRIVARHPIAISKKPVAILMLHANAFSDTAKLSSIWPGWLKMVSNLTSAPKIEEEKLTWLVARLHAIAQRLIYRHAVRALTKSNYEYAQDAASILKNFYSNKRSYYVLTALTKVCEFSHISQKIFTHMYLTVENIALLTRRNLRRRYGAFVKYL